MFKRWCIGLVLGAALMAAPPVSTRSQAWVLALDERGGLVGDLRPDELEVKVGGKVRPLTELKTPAQTADMSQSWVLVFEPIRDTTTRAVAFTAAADFLAKVPDGDRVFIVARGKDSLESLMPGLTGDRAAWASAMEKVPGMLPETLTGIPKGHLGGQGFDPAAKALPGEPGGQEKLTALLAKFQNGASWAGGTMDQKGRTALDRLNLNDSMLVSSLVQISGREMATLESILGQMGSIPGPKHMIVFSRCEMDDLVHPSIRSAMNRSFTRTKGDMGGPAETATLAVRDVTIQQQRVKEKAASSGVMLYSVAGAGPNLVGNIGTIAAETGGFCFPLRSELERQFGQGIQIFGSRHLLRWSGDASSTQPVSLEIKSKRKGIKLIAPSLVL